MEETRAFYYEGFGEKIDYIYHDEDGEALIFECTGMPITEARKLKDEWLKNKRENKEEYDELKKKYKSVTRWAERLSDGCGIVFKTGGLCLNHLLLRPWNEYKRFEQTKYCLVMQFPFCGFKHTRTYYGSSIQECADKAYESQKERADWENVSPEIKKIIEI